MLKKFVIYFVLFSCQICWTTVAGRAHKSRQFGLPEVRKVEYRLSENQSIFDYWTPERMKKALENTERWKMNNTNRNKRDLDKLFENTISGSVTVRLANKNYKPFQAYGILFFETDHGSRVCSAAYIGSSNRVLVTAGHCVMTGSSWHYEFLFKQSYSNGDVWNETEVVHMFTNVNYGGTNSVEDFALDYAFLVTKEENTRYNLGFAFSSDITESDIITAAGYPRNYYHGEHLVFTEHNACSRNIAFTTTSGHKFIKLNNDMEEKSSGGPLYIEKNGSFYAVGVNSWGFINSKGMYSPIFDSATFKVYSCAFDVAMNQCDPEKCNYCPEQSSVVKVKKT